MDENVVFPTNQGSQSPPTPQAPAPGDTAAPAANQVPQHSPPPAGDAPIIDQVELATPPVAPPGPLGLLMQNWKKLLIVIGVILLVIILINVFTPKGQVSRPVTLTWWGLWEDTPALESLINDFKKTHPNISIEYVKREPQDYRDRLMTRIDAGTGPDIFRFHNSWVPMLADRLLPLPVDVMKPEDFKNAYYPVIQHDLMKNNGIMGIPLEADSLEMFVNPELFSAAGVQVPQSWDDFRKVTKDLTIKDSTGKIRQAGAALGTFANVNHASDIVSLLFVQQGVSMDKFTQGSNDAADALDFYTSFARGENSIWNNTLDNSLLAFSKGNLAIYFGYSWDIFAIQKLNKDLQFKIYPVPQLYGKKTTIASYWVEGVSAKSKNQKEAMEFLKYLSEKETAQKFYTQSAKTRAFGEPYARKDLRETLREEPMVYPFLAGLDDASSTPFSSDTHDGDTGMNTVLNNYLQTAVESIAEGGSGQSAVEPLNNGYTQTMEKYGITQTQ